MRLVRRFRLVSTSLALIAGLCAGFADAEPAPTRPHVVSGSGTNAGGLFTASAAGAVFELPSGALIRLAADATVRVLPESQALELTHGPATTTWSLAIARGRVDIEMPANGRSAVLANLGKLDAIVTRGHVALFVKDDAVTVANSEGEAKTLLSGHFQTVPLGWVATLSHENPNATAKPGLAFPILSGGARVFFASTDTVALRGIRWSPVRGAARYDVRVRRPDGKVVAQTRVAGDEVDSGLTPVQPGKYTVALRSVDPLGLENRWGPEFELRVIGAVLPPGSYSTDRAIFLATGQQVSFTNTNGLEMTYAGAGRYFPATEAAGLHHDATTMIGFRLPGTLDTATARLEPRGIYADVHIGPRRAIWPRDPVTIDIELKSKSGEPIPPFLHAVPKVTLGLDTISPNFTQRGSTLHAIVAPSSKPGPWVVRVEVADQFGLPLGRDFLEVATAPGSKAPDARHDMAPPKAPSVPKPDNAVASSD